MKVGILLKVTFLGFIERLNQTVKAVRCFHQVLNIKSAKYIDFIISSKKSTLANTKDVNKYILFAAALQLNLVEVSGRFGNFYLGDVKNLE
jgi:hypothetical protein